MTGAPRCRVRARLLDAIDARAALVVGLDTSQGRVELPLIETMVRGEAGLSLRASHPEGRFVGELVKYMVRKWLRADESLVPPTRLP